MLLTFPTVLAPPPLTEYEKAAAEIGFDNPALQHRRIVSALTQDEIPVYRLDRVAAHMDKVVAESERARWKAEKDKPHYHSHWWWKPLRDIDAAGGAPCSNSSTRWFSGFVSVEPYPLAVPLEALRLAARVTAVLPGPARLFVTDVVFQEHSSVADPFMAVWGGLEMVPFAVWDEPGF